MHPLSAADGKWHDGWCTSSLAFICGARPTGVSVSLAPAVHGVSPPNAESATSAFTVYEAPEASIGLAMGQSATTFDNRIELTVTFSSRVTGLSSADFVVHPMEAVTDVRLQGSGTSFQLSIALATPNCSVDCTWLVNTSLPAAAGRVSPPNTAAAAPSVLYAPPQAILHASVASTQRNSIVFSANFSSPVTGVTDQAFDVDAGQATIESVDVVGSGTAYVVLVTVSPTQASHNVVLDMAEGADGVHPVCLRAASPASVQYTPPQSSLAVPSTVSVHNLISVNVTFSSPVIGLSTASFNISAHNAAIVAHLSGSGTAYVLLVTVTRLSQDISQASISVSLLAQAAGVLPPSAPAVHGVTVMYVPPVVAIDLHASQATVTASNVIRFSVNSTVAVAGLLATDFTIDTTDLAFTTSLSSLSATNFTLTITLTGSCSSWCSRDVQVTLPAWPKGMSPPNAQPASSPIVTYEPPAPTFVPLSLPTNPAMVFQVLWTAPVSNFQVSDVYVDVSSRLAITTTLDTVTADNYTLTIIAQTDGLTMSDVSLSLPPWSGSIAPPNAGHGDGIVHAFVPVEAVVWAPEAMVSTDGGVPTVSLDDVVVQLHFSEPVHLHVDRLVLSLNSSHTRVEPIGSHLDGGHTDYRVVWTMGNTGGGVVIPTLLSVTLPAASTTPPNVAHDAVVVRYRPPNVSISTPVASTTANVVCFTATFDVPVSGVTPSFFQPTVWPADTPMSTLLVPSPTANVTSDTWELCATVPIRCGGECHFSVTVEADVETPGVVPQPVSSNTSTMVNVHPPVPVLSAQVWDEAVGWVAVTSGDTTPHSLMRVTATFSVPVKGVTESDFVVETTPASVTWVSSSTPSPSSSSTSWVLELEMVHGFVFPVNITVYIRASSGAIRPPNSASVAPMTVLFAPPYPVISVLPAAAHSATTFLINFTSPVLYLQVSSFVISAATTDFAAQVMPLDAVSLLQATPPSRLWGLVVEFFSYQAPTNVAVLLPERAAGLVPRNAASREYRHLFVPLSAASNYSALRCDTGLLPQNSARRGTTVNCSLELVDSFGDPLKGVVQQFSVTADAGTTSKMTPSPLGWRGEFSYQTPVAGFSDVIHVVEEATQRYVVNGSLSLDLVDTPDISSTLSCVSVEFPGTSVRAGHLIECTISPAVADARGGSRAIKAVPADFSIWTQTTARSGITTPHAHVSRLRQLLGGFALSFTVRPVSHLNGPLSDRIVIVASLARETNATITGIADFHVTHAPNASATTVECFVVERFDGGGQLQSHGYTNASQTRASIVTFETMRCDIVSRIIGKLDGVIRESKAAFSDFVIRSRGSVPALASLDGGYVHTLWYTAPSEGGLDILTITDGAGFSLRGAPVEVAVQPSLLSIPYVRCDSNELPRTSLHNTSTVRCFVYGASDKDSVTASATHGTVTTPDFHASGVSTWDFTYNPQPSRRNYSDSVAVYVGRNAAAESPVRLHVVMPPTSKASSLGCVGQEVLPGHVLRGSRLACTIVPGAALSPVHSLLTDFRIMVDGGAAVNHSLSPDGISQTFIVNTDSNTSVFTTCVAVSRNGIPVRGSMDCTHLTDGTPPLWEEAPIVTEVTRTTLTLRLHASEPIIAYVAYVLCDLREC